MFVIRTLSRCRLPERDTPCTLSPPPFSHFVPFPLPAWCFMPYVLCPRHLFTVFLSFPFSALQTWYPLLSFPRLMSPSSFPFLSLPGLFASRKLYPTTLPPPVFPPFLFLSYPCLFFCASTRGTPSPRFLFRFSCPRLLYPFFCPPLLPPILFVSFVLGWGCSEN